MRLGIAGLVARMLLVASIVTLGLPVPAMAAPASDAKASKLFGIKLSFGEKAEEKAPTLEERKARVARDRVTQDQREAAAARMKLQQGIAAISSGMSASGFTAQAALLTTPTQGGIPDYFGSWANWAYTPPIRKFVDGLPGLGPDKANNLGNFLPVAYPDTTSYPGSDYYEIELREFEQQLHSDLPATTLRGYVQVNKGTDEFGNNTIDPDPIHYLGPTIFATKDRPVRVKFTNKLPVGEGGDLFIPVDESVMGAGEGPIPGKKYTQNRGTLHLHGGKTVWISDGTPHQWITPANEDTPYPKGVSVKNVPDMPDPGPGSMTFFYSNQQSARMLWYHDHSYGITRLNVYAGEAAGYMLTDETEQELVNSGVIPAEQIPLLIQDKTFVDAETTLSASTILDTDPTWNWGTGPKDPGTGIREPKTGDLWVPHVYVPAQNPADISAMNATGRWHYGPWFWPPVTNIRQGPIPNPYYDPVEAPWEPPLMPATPNPSMGMEHYNDTPMINGTPYPTMTVEPKAYRFRILNAANDRFFNLSFFEADPTTQSADGRLNTEVKMVPAVPTAGYPETWPKDGRDGGVPDPATAGPDWIQIGTEGGFLPKPVVIPAQPVDWNTDATTFNAGNVNTYSLLLGNAERADVVVDFSKYAGKTLILYNDAPTAFPALDPRTDYYTGMPDFTSTGGSPGTAIGFGPNTRTLMQITVEETTGTPPEYDLAALQSVFASSDTTQGVFEKSQNPVIIPDDRYESAYNTTSFPKEQYVRIFESTKTFKDLDGTTVTKQMQPKAIQDEAGETFDPEYGRMQARLGLERVGTNAANQNFIAYAYADPATEELIDNMTPLSPVSADGTQIWKITHNGVDTHPVHFHLFDVQLINHVAWDGSVRPPDDNELGWKDTVRIDPLEDTIVALKPVAPKGPFGVPDSVRPLNPALPIGSTMDFTNIDPVTGQAANPPVTNQMTNFGWEYVWHCHILSHEEMDMMRPMTVAVGRELPDPVEISGSGTPGTDMTISWTDPTPAASLDTLGNPKNEIGFRVERWAVGEGSGFAAIGVALANAESFVDTTTVSGTTYKYRVVSFNAAGESVSNEIIGGPTGFASRYEQTDPKLSTFGVWNTASVGDLSAGSYAYTMDGAMNVAFTGTAIEWVTVKMDVNGIARVSLDGGPWQDVDLYSATYQPQAVAYSATGLSAGPHTLRIEPKGTKNPASGDYWIGVDAFDVNGALTTAYPRRHEEDDALLYKSGLWTNASAPGLSKGWYSYTAGGAMEVAFTGTAIDWVTVKMDVNGIARVSLDGGPWQDVDLYSATYEPQAVAYSATGLAAGDHTLRIEPTGTKNPASGDYWIGADSFDITGTMTKAGPTRYEENDPNLAFTGTWNTASEGALSAGSYAYTGDGGVVAKFNGTSIDWITAKMPVNGIASVSVDGGAPQLVDLYAVGYEPQSTVFSASGLAPGEHTISITFTGTQNPSSSAFWVGLDAFDVRGVLVPAP